MFQPLEQFVVPYIYIPFFGFFNSILLIKPIFVFFCISLSLLLLITRKHIFIFLMKYIAGILNEMFNIVNFNFCFLIVVYISTFSFILIMNLCGLLPYAPCWTAQFFANLLLSFTLIIGLTLMNIDKNGVRFFELFTPQGVPNILKGPLFVLEFFSYFIRILSLSIRLFSNMVAGHSLLHILFDMTNNIHSTLEHFLDVFLIVSVFSLIVICVIVFFEVIVAFLQAYVFAVMFIIYANDLNLTH